MIVSACYISNRGKVRKTNEDSILISDLLISGADMERADCQEISGEGLAFMVADGMGGHQKGEVASRTVLSFFSENRAVMRSHGDIMGVVHLAKAGLNRIVEKDSASWGLGTTISGIIFNQDSAIIVSCGDSRVYRSSGGRFERMTKDHSVVQVLADSGEITEEEMRSHPQKNMITSAVMGDLKRDLPDISLLEIRTGPGQRFMICSDGLWESMDKDMVATGFSKKDLRESVDFLMGQTMESGARDNVSIIALEIVSA